MGAAIALGSGPVAAQSALLEQATAKQLSRDPYWSALLHYKRKGAGVASEIVSPEFFLAPDGATHPDAELAATLTAFFAPAAAADAHARCRFPERYRWLRKALDWGALQPPAPRCAQYDAYTMGRQVQSLSLVYATGYLSNPASFYGHILIKFNSRTGSVAYDLLERSVNYGAAVPRHENPVVYTFKGLFGGYDAVFSHTQFYNFNHEYSENELRDMWEYPLELDPDEVESIVAHSWELLGKKFVYYFLKENCGYRMAELLGLVVREPLLPDLPYALPGTVFERLARVNHHGAPLVKSVRRIPSRQNRFQDKYVALASAERSAARELVDSGVNFASPGYAALPEASRVAVTDALLDYYEYRIILERKDPEMARAKHQLLLERVRLPARSSPEEPDQSATALPPHEGPLPFMLRLGAAHNTRAGDGATLRLRPANYDALSLDAGRIPHSTLAMFDLKVALFRDEVQLRSFHAVTVENLNAARTPLPRDGGWAWDFQLGVQSHNLECSSCTVLKTTGGVGKAFGVGDKTVLFGLLDLSAQSAHAGSGTLAVIPRGGFVAAPAAAWKSYLSFGRQTFLNGARGGERVARWENRFGSSRKWDVRVAYQQHAAREFEAAFSLYW